MSIKTLRKSTAAIIAVMAFITGTLFIATPANASVWNCTTGYSTVGAFGKCLSGNTTTYRVNVLCGNIFGSHFVAGNWVSINASTQSTVQWCGNITEYFMGTPYISTP